MDVRTAHKLGPVLTAAASRQLTEVAPAAGIIARGASFLATKLPKFKSQIVQGAKFLKGPKNPKLAKGIPPGRHTGAPKMSTFGGDVKSTLGKIGTGFKTAFSRGPAGSQLRRRLAIGAGVGGVAGGTGAAVTGGDVKTGALTGAAFGPLFAGAPATNVAISGIGGALSRKPPKPRRFEADISQAAIGIALLELQNAESTRQTDLQIPQRREGLLRRSN